MYQKEEKDELSNQRVFSIKHSEIPRGITQCEVHSWIKLSDNEVKCTKCPTALLVSPEYLKELIKDNGQI